MGEHVRWEILPWSSLENTIHLCNFLRITNISLVVPLLFSLSSQPNTWFCFRTESFVNFFTGVRKDGCCFFQASLLWANGILGAFLEEKGVIYVRFLSPW